MALRDIFGPENFYLELQDHGLPGQQRVNPVADRDRAKNRHSAMSAPTMHTTCGAKTVSRTTCFCASAPAKSSAKPDRMRYESDQFYFKSPEEMKQTWGHMPEALCRTRFGWPNTAI